MTIDFAFVTRSQNLNLRVVRDLKLTQRAMAIISDLPNEIIREILGFIQPEDLENFAQTSKHIHYVSEQCVRTHRELIPVYKVVRNPSYPGQKRDGRLYGPIPLSLREVFLNPRVGHYVKDMRADDLIGRSLDDDISASTEEHWERDFALWEEFTDLLKGHHFKHPLAHHSSFPNSCRISKGLEDSGECLMILLLLPLLPGLRTPSIRWVFDNLNPSNLLKGIENSQSSVLPNLTSVRLKTFGRSRIRLLDLDIFSRLPSLRILAADATWNEMTLDDSIVDQRKSNVTHLQLTLSNVGSRSLQAYLRPYDKLLIFHLDCRPYEDSDLNGISDAATVGNALLTQAKSTLRSLTLLYPCYYGFSIGSFQDFDTLEYIHTDWSNLFPNPLGPYDLIGDCLPRSIQHLEIQDEEGRKPEQYQAMLNAIWTSNLGDLSNLDYLRLDVPSDAVKCDFDGENDAELLEIGDEDKEFWLYKFQDVGLDLMIDAVW